MAGWCLSSSREKQQKPLPMHEAMLLLLLLMATGHSRTSHTKTAGGEVRWHDISIFDIRGLWFMVCGFQL
jgi:hypothetical protein